jgi:hypothetical protein
MEENADDCNYLRSCREAFSEICQKKYGKVFDLGAVEANVKHLRRKTPITYQDLAYFESPEHWWFQRFWVFPPESRIGEELKKAVYDFWNVNEENEAGLIRQLLFTFKSIELVSIIFRFIRPDQYAIYSSPVVHLLDLRRMRDLVETYCRYLSDLREILGHYELKRVADVDMALWVLHEKCYGTHRDPVIASLFQQDTFMLRIRARNLVAPLADLSDACLANALTDVKPELASLVGSFAFEILVRRLAESFGMTNLGTEVKLQTIIDNLPNYGPVDPVRKANWKRLKDIRDALFHAGRMPSGRERKDLVEEVMRLERDVTAGKKRTPGNG